MKQPGERLFLQRQIEKHGKKYSILQPIEHLMAGHIYGTGKMLMRNGKTATPLIIFEAGRGVRDYQLSYYDAQIWATARLNQIPTIFSEDFNNGATLEGVQFINPFAPDFVMEIWL